MKKNSGEKEKIYVTILCSRQDERQSLLIPLSTTKSFLRSENTVVCFNSYPKKVAMLWNVFLNCKKKNAAFLSVGKSLRSPHK